MCEHNQQWTNVCICIYNCKEKKSKAVDYSLHPKQSDDHKYEPQTFITLSIDGVLHLWFCNWQLILDP